MNDIIILNALNSFEKNGYGSILIIGVMVYIVLASIFYLLSEWARDQLTLKKGIIVVCLIYSLFICGIIMCLNAQYSG